MNTKFPCVCGHDITDHVALGGSDETVCRFCYNQQGESASLHEFKLNNLRYLEELSK